MKKITMDLVASGRDVDLFRGRHTDYVKQLVEEATLKVIQARNDVHGEGGLFKVRVEWHPEGWLEAPTKATIDLREVEKKLLAVIDSCSEWRDVGLCKDHSEQLRVLVVDYRVKREIKGVEDEKLKKEEADGNAQAS